MAIVTIWPGPSTKRHNLATPAEGSPTSDVFQNHKPFFCSPHSPAACAFTALALASIKQPEIGLRLGCQSAFFLSAILPSCPLPPPQPPPAPPPLPCVWDWRALLSLATILLCCYYSDLILVLSCVVSPTQMPCFRQDESVKHPPPCSPH
jgi:hypothetical protein